VSKENAEGWKQRLRDREGKPEDEKVNAFENEKTAHSRRMHDEHLNKTENIPSEKARLDKFNKRPTNEKNTYENEKTAHSRI